MYLQNNLEVKQITESLRVARLGLEAGIRMLKRFKPLKILKRP